MDNIHVALPNLNPTDIWMSPGDAINSTQSLDHATQLDAVAYQANRWLFVGMMIILIWAILAQMPHTIVRIIAARSGWEGLLLRKTSGRKKKLRLTKSTSQSEKDRTEDASVVTVATARNASPPKPPRRLRHLHLSLPIYTFPIINLPLPQFLVVFFTAGASIGVAAWCQASFLTDASRSTLVVMALMCLAAGLGMKAGGVGTWLQIGYTAVNFLHRWLGRVVLLLSTLHVVAYLVVFYKAGVAQEEMAKPANYLGAMAYGGLLLVGIVSIRPIRCRWWWAFKFGHHIGIVLLLAGLNYHSGDIVPYLIALWILISINIVLRAVTTRYTLATLKILPGADSTLITFPKYTKGFVPGQHVRVRMWSLITMSEGGMRWKDAIESHPFTISTPADGDLGIQLIVKRAGNWTKEVCDLAERNGGSVDVMCSIEGPYAGPLNFTFPAFASVLVAVGGSGISFGLGVARGLLEDIRNGRSRCTYLAMVWTVREKDHFEALELQLKSLIETASIIIHSHSDFRLSLELYYTSKTSTPSSPEVEEIEVSQPYLRDNETSNLSLKIRNSRPDLDSILGRVVDVTAKGGVGVGVCGPSGMVETMEKLVRAVSRKERQRVEGVEIHSEAFSL